MHESYAGHRNACSISRQALRTGRARVGLRRPSTRAAIGSDGETALQEPEVVAEIVPDEVAEAAEIDAEPAVEVQATQVADRRTPRRGTGAKSRNITVQIQDIEVGQTYPGKVVSGLFLWTRSAVLTFCIV